MASSQWRFLLGAEMKALRCLRIECLQVISILIVLTTFGWMSSTVPCWGQANTGTISGTVTDPTGAVIPQADVTVTNTSTGVTSSTTANASGHYAFLALPPGTYNLSAVKTGFATSKFSGIPLRIYQQLTQDVILKVGAATQTITVQAAPTLVNTTNASLGTTVGQKTILDMPLDLREVGALALLVPGTVNTTGRSLATGAANGSGFNDFGYSGSGGQSGGNLMLIDGMISRALNNSSFALDPPPEMVREFKIQNNIYDASFGLASGTVMNLVTQSGTNAIHGSGYEFVRNETLDAIPFGAISKPALSRNQFGGVIGGPIVKNKIFYFGGYEGLRLTQGQISPSIVPTPAQRSGNFSSFLTGTTANLCAASGSAAPPNLNFDTGPVIRSGFRVQLHLSSRSKHPRIHADNHSGGHAHPWKHHHDDRSGGAEGTDALPTAEHPRRCATTPMNLRRHRQNDQFDARVDATVSK